MDLTQPQVDEFMAADKLVHGEAIEWEATNAEKGAWWRGQIAVEGAFVGHACLFANLYLPRGWAFKLVLHGEEVYRLDVKNGPSRHHNPPNRPDGFKRKVRCPEHEHVWRLGLGVQCATELDGLSTASHEEVMQVFCQRARTEFEAPYSLPGEGNQMSLENQNDGH